MEKESAEIIGEAFNKFFNDIIKPYITACNLISQKCTLNLVKEIISKANSKEEALKILEDFDKCYKEEIDKINKGENND